MDVPILGEIEVVVEDDVVLAKRVDLELVLVVLAKGVPLEDEARAPKPKVVQIGFRLVAFIGPQVLIVDVGVEHLDSHPDSQLEVVVGTVDLDALARPELDVPPVDDVVPHHLVFALGMKLIARNLTSNPFLGLCILVGLFRRVVLPHLRLGRRQHDHGRALGRLGLVDRVLTDSCCSSGSSAITSSEVRGSSVVSESGEAAGGSLPSPLRQGRGPQRSSR